MSTDTHYDEMVCVTSKADIIYNLFKAEDFYQVLVSVHNLSCFYNSIESTSPRVQECVTSVETCLQCSGDVKLVALNVQD